MKRNKTVAMTGSPKHDKKQNEIAIAERRKIVAANILAGVTYREIAENRDVSVGTITEDVKAILAEWRENYAADGGKWLEIQLRRLDVLLNAIWDDARGGKDNTKMDRALAILDRISNLTGVSKIRHEHSGPDGKPITFKDAGELNDDELARIAAGHAPASRTGTPQKKSGPK